MKDNEIKQPSCAGHKAERPPTWFDEEGNEFCSMCGEAIHPKPLRKLARSAIETSLKRIKRKE